MAHKRKRIFDGLYAQLEETDGNVVLFSARGEPSVIFEITNPVQQLCTDAQQYMLFHDVLSNILQTIGEGYALQKQDILCRQAYHHDVPDDAEFLTRSYFRYFEGREFTEIRTFLILTQEAQRSQFIQYDPKRWLDFHAKVSKTDDIQYGTSLYRSPVKQQNRNARLVVSLVVGASISARSSSLVRYSLSDCCLDIRSCLPKA